MQCCLLCRKKKAWICNPDIYIERYIEIRQRNNRRHWKERNKTILFVDNMIMCFENVNITFIQVLCVQQLRRPLPLKRQVMSRSSQERPGMQNHSSEHRLGTGRDRVTETKPSSWFSGKEGTRLTKAQQVQNWLV